MEGLAIINPTGSFYIPSLFLLVLLLLLNVILNYRAREREVVYSQRWSATDWNPLLMDLVGSFSFPLSLAWAHKQPTWLLHGLWENEKKNNIVLGIL